MVFTKYIIDFGQVHEQRALCDSTEFFFALD